MSRGISDFSSPRGTGFLEKACIMNVCSLYWGWRWRMVRPRKLRFVGMEPGFRMFKPVGIPAVEIDQVVLTLDEFEALRLVDFEGMDHEGAAALIEISRPTLSRLVENARHKIAEAIVVGRALVIDGGNVEMVSRRRCGDCGWEIPRGRGGGRHRCGGRRR